MNKDATHHMDQTLVTPANLKWCIPDHKGNKKDSSTKVIAQIKQEAHGPHRSPEKPVLINLLKAMITL